MKSRINSPHEMRDYFSQSGRYQPASFQPAKPRPYWDDLSPSRLAIPEGRRTVTNPRYSMSAKLEGLPAGFTLPPSSINGLTATLEPGTAYSNDLWQIQSVGYNRTTNTATFILVFIGTEDLDHESTPIIYVGIRLEMPESPSTAEASRVYSLPVIVSDITEAPVRIIADPIFINVNANDPEPVITDLSRYFRSEDDAHDWQLTASTPFSPTRLGTLSFIGHRLSFVPAGPSQIGQGSLVANAQNVGDLSAISVNGVGVQYNVTLGLHTVRWTWAITNTDSLPRFIENDDTFDEIYLIPGTDGSTTAVNLGNWRANATSNGVIGAKTYALENFSLTSGRGIDVNDLNYDANTGNFTYTGGKIPADAAFQVDLVSKTAATSTASAGETRRTIKFLVGYVPVITFDADGWQTIKQLAETDTGKTESVMLARIGYSYTGVPSHVATDDFLIPSWVSVVSDGDTAFRMETASNNKGELVYYGHGRQRSVATRVTVTPTLTLTQAAGDVKIFPSSKTAPAYMVHILPPPPTFREDSYEFHIADGSLPSTASQTDRFLGQIDVVAGDGYRRGAVAFAKNSGDVHRQFASDNSANIWYSGPLSISRSIEDRYDLEFGAVQVATDGDVSPVGRVPIAIIVDKVSGDEVVLNPDWSPQGGLTRSIVVGGTTSIDASDAWRIPEGSTQSISGVVAPLQPEALISSSDTNDVFMLTGLATGTATLTISNTVTLPNGETAENVPTIVVTIEVHDNFVDTPYKWLQRSGTPGSYTYEEITQATTTLAEGSASTENFTDARLYFWCPDLQNREVGVSIDGDSKNVWTLDTAAEVIPVPGITGNQRCTRLRPTSDGTRLDFETLHSYGVRIEVWSHADTDSNPEYGAFTQYLPLIATVTDVNELPQRRTNTPFEDITIRVGAGTQNLELGNRWSDPEGRTLNFEVTSSSPNVASGSLVQFGQVWQWNPRAVGTTTISVRCNDGTTPISWVTPDTFTITVEAGDLIAPVITWQSPQRNLAIQTSESAAVGSALVKNMWASTDIDDVELSYDIIDAPDVLLPLDLSKVNMIWWNTFDSRWYVAGTLDTPITGTGNYAPQGAHRFDEFGSEVPLPLGALRPSVRSGGALDARSRFSEIMAVAPYQAVSTVSAVALPVYSVILAGRGGPQALRGGRSNTNQPGENTIYAQSFIAFTPPSPGRWFSRREFYVQFSDIVYSMVSSINTLNNPTSRRLWATEEGQQKIKCYNIGAGPANSSTSSAEDVGNTITPPAAICDQPQAMALDDDEELLFVVCRKGSDYSVRAWNWPARTRSEDDDETSTTISGRALSMEIIGDWIYVLHYIGGENAAAGKDVAYIYIGE